MASLLRNSTRCRLHVGSFLRYCNYCSSDYPTPLSFLLSSGRRNPHRPVQAVGTRDLATTTTVQVIRGTGPVFSSQAVIRKQSDRDLSQEELALKRAFQDWQSLQEEEDHSNTDSRKKSLERLLHCLETLEYWEDCLSAEAELESYADSSVELAAGAFRQGKLHVRLDQLVLGNAKYHRALELYRAEHGDIYHADLGNVMVAMAGVEFARENIDACLATLNAAEIHFRNHGSSTNDAIPQEKPHPDITRCLENQGMMYRLKQEFFQALEKYEEALQVVGESDLEKRQKFQLHIADMLGVTGDGDGAIHYYHKIQEEDRARRSCPEEDTALDGVILHCVGLLHTQQRRLELARDELTQAADIKRRVGGETNPEVAASLVALGSVHGVLGNQRAALDAFQEALIIVKATVEDENDPEVLQILRNIAILKGDKVAKWDA